MIVDRTFNVKEIEKIIYHKDVIQHSTESGKKGAIDPESDCFIGTYKDNKLVGLFIFCPLNSVSLDVHCYFLPEYRKELSKDSYLKSVEYVFNKSNYQKLIVKCQSNDWHVKRFCLNNGFVLEGKLTKSAIFKNRLVDEYLLGMTKEQFTEYKECLH